MKIFECESLYDGSVWIENCLVEVDEYGIILRMGEFEHDGSNVELLKGWLVPGFRNAHSHAFQYAMAGMTEQVPPQSMGDDFWSWRESMYSFALQVSPDQLEVIATMLYSEMLRQGYTQVLEFHYLHNDLCGERYVNIAEMGERLVAAAEKAGIGITLAPMYYSTGDFGKPASERQRRFTMKDLGEYYRLLDSAEQAVEYYKDANLAVGFHSLRAASDRDLKQLCSECKPGLPLHLHISEQVREVESCVEYYGRRPVQWLLEQVDVDSRFNLVHATHLDQSEISGLADSGATVVLCPGTEANLGDGVFPLVEYHALGGNWSIGTDSHISLFPFEELRLLEYGQRLTRRRRNVLCENERTNTGKILFDQALSCGVASMGESLSSPVLAVGRCFDALLLNNSHPALSVSSVSDRLDTLVFASDSTVIKGVLRRGDWLVRDGLHAKLADFQSTYQNVVEDLKSSI